MTPPPSRDGDVVLGDDWVAPDSAAAAELRVNRERRGLMSLRSSPLTRKIITLNLIALVFLFSGIVYLNSSRDALTFQRGTWQGRAVLPPGPSRIQRCSRPRWARRRALRGDEADQGAGAHGFRLPVAIWRPRSGPTMTQRNSQRSESANS